MKNCEIINMINRDFFAKRIAWYKKGTEKESTFFGKFLSLLYISIYLIIVIYNICIVFMRTSITVYDAEIYPEKLAEIKINKELLSFYFGLQDPVSYNEIFDERIYYAKAFYRHAIRHNKEWLWEYDELELGKCELSDFGERYKYIYQEKEYTKGYCIKNLDRSLFGEHARDNYSMLYLSFYPCINSTKNNYNCKSQEEINYYLNGTFLGIEAQNIYMSPSNFTNSTQPTVTNVYTYLGQNFYKEYYLLYQIVEIDKDEGFLFERTNSDYYLRYIKDKEETVLKNLDVYNTGESFCNVTIKLEGTILREKISYYKITSMLTNLGGLSIFFSTFFKILAYFPSNMLYKINIVNELFKFNVSKYKINIKEKYKFPDFEKNKNLFEDLLKSSKNKILFKKNKTVINKNYSELNNSNIILDNQENNKTMLKINKNFLKDTKNNNSMLNDSKTELKKKLYNNNFIYKNENEIIKKINVDNSNKKDLIIDTLNITKSDIYFFSIFCKKRNIKRIILLNEGFKLFQNSLDIINHFKNTNIINKIILDLKEYFFNDFENYFNFNMTEESIKFLKLDKNK